MKKVLLATTALVLSAGVASAEVSVSGNARVGLTYNEANAQSTLMDNRVRIAFSASGETDSGLSYSASARIRTGNEGGASVNAFNELGVTISGAFGSLTVGSESSAAEYAVGDLAGVGFTGAGAGNENNFGGASVVYTYSTDALTAMVSIGESAGNGGNTLDSDTLAMGVSYAAGAVTVAVGYEMGAADDHIIAGVTYAMGDTTVKATYGTQGDDSQMGASVAHKMGSISLAGFYRTTETGGADADFYGVGAAYDLGGGAAVKAGFANNDGTTRMEAGINLSF
jgi:outer membrane protein OmpU